MEEVRASVDAMDELIVGLLGKRMKFMEAAARIKPEREQVRDEKRKAAVIANASAAATRTSFPPQAIADVYEIIVETSIAYELKRWDDLRAANS